MSASENRTWQNCGFRVLKKIMATMKNLGNLKKESLRLSCMPQCNQQKQQKKNVKEKYVL